MSKYIRTKDKIYSVEEYSSNAEIIINKEYCIKTADTIEELCDMFIVVGKDNHRFMQIDFIRENYSPNLWDIYGAIWTPKGLIYVAQLNERGELELL